MESNKYSYTVESLKTRLDKYLAEVVKGVSRSKIQRDIEAGLVTVNQEVIVSPKHVVRKGDEILYKPSHEEAPAPKNIPLQTLYNKNGLLIIDKPAGLVVHPGAGFKGDSLVQALLYHFKDIESVGEEGRSGIVHRLDKDTSGVMLVALSQKIYEYLKDSFSGRKIKKEYIALLKGNLEKPHGQIDSALGKSKKDFRKITTDKNDMVLEKPSLTEYWVLEHLTSGVDDYTLVRVKLHTGRTHQIRVHFASLGYPLAGDTLYGSKRVALKGLERQFLHAKKIEVQLPDNQWIEAESQLPSDLRKVLKSLKSKIVNSL